jgi:hypothetical protein
MSAGADSQARTMAPWYAPIPAGVNVHTEPIARNTFILSRNECAGGGAPGAEGASLNQAISSCPYPQGL